MSRKNLVAEYVGKLAKTGTAPGNNTDPTETRDNSVGAASYDGTLSPDFAHTSAAEADGKHSLTVAKVGLWQEQFFATRGRPSIGWRDS